jgi:hypothetical protein
VPPTPRIELVRLLQRTREWLNGCRGANAPSEDEPCECAECEEATALLEAVDAALDDAKSGT